VKELFDSVVKIFNDHNYLYVLLLSLIILVGYLIKKLIDKDPYKFLSKLKVLFHSSKIEIVTQETQAKEIFNEISNEELAIRITGYNKEERTERYNEMIKDIRVVSYLKKWNNRFYLSNAFDDYKDGVMPSDEFEKRIWNARLWLTTKTDTFAKGLEELTSKFKKAYVDFDEEIYDKFLNYSYWQDLTLDGVKLYSNQCKILGMNADFLLKITEKHENAVNRVLDSICSILSNGLYKKDPTYVYESCMGAYKDAFDESFRHMNELLHVNGPVTALLLNWNIPKTDNEFNLDIKELSLKLNGSKNDMTTSFNGD
jgi:hypothetical protein